MQSRNTNRAKHWIWLSGGLIFFCAAVGIGWHFFKKDLAKPQSKIARPLLVNELKKMLNEASDGLYHLQYSKFDLDINAGTGLIKGLKLTPDSLALRRLIAQHKAPNNVFTLTMDSLALSKFGFVKGQTGRYFIIGAITVYHPEIKIVNRRRDNQDSKGKQSLLMKLALNLLKGLTAKRIAVHNMTLTYLNENGNAGKHTALKNLNVNITDLAINSGPEPGMQMARLRFSTPDSLYHINLDGMQLSQKSRRLLIRQTTIEPRLSIPAFYSKVRYDKDRIHMVFNHMRMARIDIAGFLRTQQLHIGLITVASSWGEVFNDYNWPGRLPPLRNHKYPHERLQQLALDLTIDTFLMHRGLISYKMRTRKSGEVANFYLNHSEGRYYNITNNAVAKRRNRQATAILDSRVMGAANLNAVFKFNLSAKNGAFNYAFRMGKMDGRALDTLSRPLALTKIESATIDSLNLKINADDHVARGNIDLYYNDMQVALLKPDKNTDTLKKKKLLTFFTNLALPNDNPAKNGKFRKGPVNVSRDARMSFLGFMYKSMLDGATSSILGFNQHKNKPDKNIIIGIGHKIVKPQKRVNTGHH